MLILADSTASAEQAAAFVDGDATLRVGPEPLDDRDPEQFARVTISGPLDDESWMSSSFSRAASALESGGRVWLLLPRPLTSERAYELHLVDLPPDVTKCWRVVGLVFEHPSSAAVLVPAADTDGAADTAVDFRLLQLVVFLCRNPDLVSELDIASVRRAAWRRPADVDPDRAAEIAELRRQLESYRRAPLGRATSAYRRVLRRLRRYHS